MPNESSQVFATVGGISVDVFHDLVVIEQEGVNGAGDMTIEIPRRFLADVLLAIFEELDFNERKGLLDGADAISRREARTMALATAVK